MDSNFLVLQEKAKSHDKRLEFITISLITEFQLSTITVGKVNRPFQLKLFIFSTNQTPSSCNTTLNYCICQQSLIAIHIPKINLTTTVDHKIIVHLT